MASKHEMKEHSRLGLDEPQMASEKSRRHCAFCLKRSAVVMVCEGCRKRAYCSDECRRTDWSISGQRHRNWCGKCGEEDVDWEVVPIPSKGLGVVALRRLPAKFRIMVEPVFTDPLAHPGELPIC